MKSTSNNPNIMLVSLNCGAVVVKSEFEWLSGVGVWLVNPLVWRAPAKSDVLRFGPGA